MKAFTTSALFALAVAHVLPVSAIDIKRSRPAGWEGLVPGARFMDRFDRAPALVADKLTDACWGGDNVKPRDIRNGVESPDYSYWGGNILEVDGVYHLFVARWKESEPKGHMVWLKSEIAHCTSTRPDGDFKVVEVIGKGHNPELFRCKDGSWAVYCINDRWAAQLYRAKSVNGPWRCERMKLDLNGHKLIETESNFSFCTRPDGSILAVCRGGGIWVSEDGLKPFVQQTDRRVYPDVEGRFEDPVLWRDEVQYHIIVNDWYGRVAWYLTSPDGIRGWTVQPGEAYTPGIAPNDWYKYERMRILQDAYGRIVQANFAVIDCVKPEDLGSDNHSSKNVCLPVNPGRRITSLRLAKEGWEVRVASEPGFDAAKDVDVGSLVFGPQTLVAFGQGLRALKAEARDGDLVLTFPCCDIDAPVVKLLGREKSGRLFFATARTDGTSLGPVRPVNP